GNDPELDPDRPADPPTKAIDKPTARSGKRNAPAEAPSRAAGASTRAPKDSGNANDNYIRDRGVGSDKNRSRGSGEPGEYRGRGRGRGGRGGRGGRPDDRHSKTGLAEHEKQAAQAWGGNDGNAELADEQAGDAIAKADEKVAAAEDAAPEAEPEPEDKSKSYDVYLAELAEKKLQVQQNLRKANEGSSKKFPEGTAISREDEEDFISGSGGKAKRVRERKEKAVVELDGDRMLQAPPREGGFGRGRGGRGRGEGRGGRGDRGDRGGRGRGEGRGEGRPRGGRGGQGGPTPNLSDSSAFPSLGS
ncbi:hypothetical protein CC80DRAFT_408772, partial [Byssothecium circinans]